MLRRNLFALTVMAVFISSCRKDAVTPPKYDFTVPPGCDASSVQYSPDVRLILGRNCAYSGCHYPGEGNYDFTEYEVVADRIRSGRFTERIYLPLGHALHMPVDFNMDSCDFAQLMTWIENGFPEN